MLSVRNGYGATKLCLSAIKHNSQIEWCINEMLKLSNIDIVNMSNKCNLSAGGPSHKLLKLPFQGSFLR